MPTRNAIVTFGLWSVITSFDVAYACLWTYGTDAHGSLVEFQAEPVESLLKRHKPLVAELESRKTELERQLEEDSSVEVRNNYAVMLIRLGQERQAIDILKKIESEKGGEYAIAANLGTAYELTGELDSALDWIKEAIRRNPRAHYSTEWLHVRILEAKRQLTNSPNWLDTNSVVGISFGENVVPVWPSDAEHPVEITQNAILYQLHERSDLLGGPWVINSSVSRLPARMLTNWPTPANPAPKSSSFGRS